MMISSKIGMIKIKTKIMIIRVIMIMIIRYKSFKIIKVKLK